MAIVEMASVTRTPLDILELRHRRRDTALAQLSAAAARHGVVRDERVLVALLARRERLGTTALGKGVALIHARSIVVTRPFWVVGRAARGIEWAAPDGVPVQLAVLYVAPSTQSAAAHLGRVSAAAHALRQQRTRQRLATVEAAAAMELLQGDDS